MLDCGCYDFADLHEIMTVEINIVSLIVIFILVVILNVLWDRRKKKKQQENKHHWSINSKERMKK